MSGARRGRFAGVARLRRRAPLRVLSELHYQLRTEGGSPVASALSVALGTFIGCLPVYGLHLLLCATLAPLFRLSRLKAYLAAHVNNVFTAPLLLYLEVGTGHWLFERAWPAIEIETLRQRGAWFLGRDLLAGSLLVGVVLAALLGLAAFGAGRQRRATAFTSRLLDDTASRYLGSGILAWEFVRGKLRHDPVYLRLIEAGVLPAEGRILDLGCGRGILLALLHTARALGADGSRGAAPRDLVGLERRPRLVAQGREALEGAARIEVADLEDCGALPQSRAIVLLDVLHYLSPKAQETVLDRAAAALEMSGVLVIRESDAARGVRHLLTRSAERVCALGRGHWRQRFRYRAAAAWGEALAARGLAVSSRPMWKGTPFANVLLVGQKGPTPVAAPPLPAAGTC